MMMIQQVKCWKLETFFKVYKKNNKNSEALLDETERYAKQIITPISILFVKSDIKILTL